jgi:pSer/pThr/pTyr-binding forkhead associated (FHA) protein
MQAHGGTGIMMKEQSRSNDSTITQPEDRKFKSSGLLIKKGLFLVLSENFFGSSFVIDKDVTYIGRGKESDLRLGDPLVSKVHSKISVDEEGLFFIEDLGPKNPTHVNRKELKNRRQLLYGDRIVMGDTILRFFLEEKLEKKKGKD